VINTLLILLSLPNCHRQCIANHRVTLSAGLCNGVISVEEVSPGDLTMLPTFALESFCAESPEYAERESAAAEEAAVEAEEGAAGDGAGEEVVAVDGVVEDSASDEGTAVVNIPFISDNMRDGELPLWELPEVRSSGSTVYS
jgi:hypothetical protein